MAVADCIFLHLCVPAVNQTASAIPKTWRKPNEGISAGDAPQKEDEVRRGPRLNKAQPTVVNSQRSSAYTNYLKV